MIIYYFFVLFAFIVLWGLSLFFMMSMKIESGMFQNIDVNMFYDISIIFSFIIALILTGFSFLLNKINNL